MRHKKHKSTSYIAGIDARRLTEPLAKSRQGLEEWIELNKGKKKGTESEPSPQTPNHL